MGLSGKIAVSALIGLRGIRTLSFTNNNFSGRIPEFNRLGALRAIYLSGNQFSGDIPSDFFAKMESLKKLWLSDNKFSGSIPSSLAQLPHLIELHLENNQFSGAIPAIDRPTLVSLDLSNNKLEGEIPEGLSKFNATSFAGNEGLCGGKSGKLCREKAVELDYGSHVSDDLNVGASTDDSKKTIAGVSTLAILLLFVAAVVFVKAKRKEDDDFDVIGKEESSDEAFEVQVSVTVLARKEPEIVTRKPGSSRKGSSRGKAEGNKKLGELVIVNDEKGTFGLTDLMKAAAEVLGNGVLGSCYKATMANGVTVVVKRIREMNAIEKIEFEAESRKLASFRHPNLLTPVAFHYWKEEKLMVYEYIPNGSLLYLQHGMNYIDFHFLPHLPSIKKLTVFHTGDRGPSHAELDWPSRLRIIQGIAKGLGHLYTELASHDLPHGNLKSSNVLLGPDNVPLLADYGYSKLANQSILAQALFAYKAPEVARYGQISPKCDVYCLRIIIFEIITGKFPAQYLCNGNGGTDIVQWVASAIPEGRESELIDPQIASNYNSLGEI
ncbi:putative Leucine-rich repeat protein kinase family protein [Tripterygium wilfordii]|uniref:Putative Leucine-rich repeat protein kinase family protein n=1 Tax=Tripterygium wilfordii TaxID=458696 RepID=A0A7J7DBW3_TRIWF|nr:putative Leucine-rich repeat protein kinase family protein [Tripterygium wilfordii]